ncbi:MAG: UPF0175 family protein [Halobacteria archaeon]
MDEKRALAALQRYYLEDVSFERAAELAGSSLYEFVEFVRKYELPLVHTERDVAEGIRRLDGLLGKHGMRPLLAKT